MGADGGAHLDGMLRIHGDADGLQLLCQKSGNGRLVGVHHIEGKIRVCGDGSHLLALVIDALAHTHGFGRDPDGATLFHSDDGLDVCQSSQFIDRLGNPAALIQIFQGIDTGKQGDPAADILDAGNDLFRGLAFVPEFCRVLDDEPLTAGGIHTVHHMAVLIAQEIFRHHRILISTAERGGQGDIDGAVTGSVGFFKQIHQNLRAGLGSLGRMLRRKKQLIELIFAQIHILLIFILSAHDSQGNAGNI